MVQALTQKAKKLMLLVLAVMLKVIELLLVFMKVLKSLNIHMLKVLKHKP